MDWSWVLGILFGSGGTGAVGAALVNLWRDRKLRSSEALDVTVSKTAKALLDELRTTVDRQGRKIQELEDKLAARDETIERLERELHQRDDDLDSLQRENGELERRLQEVESLLNVDVEP